MKRTIMSIALMAALCFAAGASAQSQKVSAKACKKECVEKCDGKKIHEKAVCKKQACDGKTAATGKNVKNADCCREAAAKQGCAKERVKADCKKAAECREKACDKMTK